MSSWAVVVAAGGGTRLAAGVPKALVPLAGKPMLVHSLDAIESCGAFAGVVVACGSSWLGQATDMVGARLGSRGRVVAGGDSRQGSVRAALDQVPVACGEVIVHDAARPLAAPDLYLRALGALERASGAVCAVRVTDTVKQTAGDVVTATLDRASLWLIQTPQAFRLDALLDAHEAARRGGVIATDDASLLERAGATVVVVPGDERNLKITTPGDLAIAEALLGL